MERIWKDIAGYEGLYKISNYGEVYSVRLQRLLKEWSSNEGYRKVDLNKNGERTHFLVHRLVGESFVPNPDKLPCINHKDENPKNNRYDNLEWCTYKYNCNYGGHNKRISESKKGCIPWNKGLTKTDKRVASYIRYGKENHNYGRVPSWSKSVRCIELNKTFVSVSEAARKMNIRNQYIRNACNGKQKKCRGYRWEWA